MEQSASPSVKRRLLDKCAEDGSSVYEFTISNKDKSVELKCVSYGATIMEIKTPNRAGVSENIVLCYETVHELETKLGPYYGAVPGRFANRIANGKFSLDGETYNLAINNGPNSLHGGVYGFDRKNWMAAEFGGSSGAGVKFSYVSSDNEEGYPGELHVDVTYTLNDLSELVIDYSAITVGKATVLNLTNHTYFNLSGGCCRPALDHKLQLSCSHYLPSNTDLLPTGEIRSVLNTDFDFLNGASNGTRLGDVIFKIDGGGKPGLDHNFLVDGFTMDQWAVRQVAILTDEESGRQVQCSSSTPGIQIYTGNWLPEKEKEEGDSKGFNPHFQHNAVCLETQFYPDSPNQPSFPSTVLRPGETYQHKTIFTFTTIA